MGATHTIHAGRENVVERVMELTNGEGAHFVFEAVGTAKTFQQTVEVARDGGFVVLLGLAQELQIPMPMVEALIKEVNFVTSFRYNNIFEEAITLMAHKRVDVSPMITHEYPFEKTLEAFYVAEHAKDKAIKVMINI
jgi:threonine dehydrogenase-like Zn-dependent dehydrogenase